MNVRHLVLAALFAVGGLQSAHAATLELLSTGAVEPGIKLAAERFQKATGHEIDITYRTAPEVRRLLESGTVADLAIAVPATIAAATQAGILEPGAVTLGRVGVGVAVRQGAPRPDISSAESLRQAALEADGIVYSRGSTGQYSEGLLKKLGIFQQVEAKVTQMDRGAEAMQRVARGKGREFAFGALTEIASQRDAGIVLVGELPADLQNYTTYVIARMTKAPNAAVAAQFLEYLATPESRSDFRSQGITE